MFGMLFHERLNYNVSNTLQYFSMRSIKMVILQLTELFLLCDSLIESNIGPM